MTIKSRSKKFRLDLSKSKRVIKKYSDRRLYDTKTSRYVKLNDIARMVREGIDVKVVDARSGKDLTYITLSQIILETAREREAPLPLQLLQQLVRASDKATHEFLSWYLDSTLDFYQKAQDTLRTRFPEAKAVAARPIEFLRKLLAGYSWPPSRLSPGVTEAEQLRHRLAQLEARLARRTRSARRRQKAAGHKQ